MELTMQKIAEHRLTSLVLYRSLVRKPRFDSSRILSFRTC
jgi:hypothetical protein